MADRWEFAVCDENGEMHEMSERMARTVVVAGQENEEEWTLYRRHVQIGDWVRER